MIDDMGREPSRPAQAKVSVGTSSVLLVPYKRGRDYVVIGGPVTDRITLGYGQPAVLDEGLTLYPASMPWLVCRRSHGSLAEGPIYAISSAGTQVVAYVEG